MRLKRFLCVLIAIAAFCGVMFGPDTAHAVQDDMHIDQLERVYTMQSDGSALVSQTVSFVFSKPASAVQVFIGSFSTPPEDLSVRINSTQLYNRSAQGYDRDTHLYNYKATSSGGGCSFSCRFPEKQNGVTVTFNYTLYNTTTIYADAAILDAALIDDTGYDITSARTVIQLPAACDAKLIDVFWNDYHLAPESQTDGTSVTVRMQDVSQDTYVHTQIALPTELFPDVSTGSRLKAEVLDDLRSDRDSEITYINYHTWFSSRQPRIIIVSIIAAILLGYITRIRRRRHRPISVSPSRDVLPTELSPMQFSLLMGFYKRNGKRRRAKNALYGTLISLVDRGILSVYPVEDDTNDCEIVYTPWEGCQTSGDENILLLLLFEDIAGGESSVTLSQIKAYCKLLPGVVSSALRHMNDYAISEMAQAHNIEFFRFVKLPLDFLFQMGFIAGAAFMAYLQCWSAAFTMLASVFIISFCSRDRLHRLSRSGEDLFERGSAFRRYVIDCTTQQEADDKPELSWWSSVLGHAAAIGLLPHLERVLPQMYPELNQEDFASEHEGSAPLWGLCAEASIGMLSTSLANISDVLLHTQRVIERSDTEK
ncbi:MAG: DUF2207 domain-containing protein [Clostridia bacterium]|nr:DUF2207 domain-containing protein [Clostridia bacterium]